MCSSFATVCVCVNPVSTPLQVDIYGTQQPIALLKLLLERGGMYDRGKDLNWKVYKDIGFLAAMGKVHNLLLYERVRMYCIYVACSCI